MKCSKALDPIGSSAFESDGRAMLLGPNEFVSAGVEIFSLWSGCANIVGFQLVGADILAGINGGGGGVKGIVIGTGVHEFDFLDFWQLYVVGEGDISFLTGYDVSIVAIARGDDEVVLDFAITVELDANVLRIDDGVVPDRVIGNETADARTTLVPGLRSLTRIDDNVVVDSGLSIPLSVDARSFAILDEVVVDVTGAALVNSHPAVLDLMVSLTIVTDLVVVDEAVLRG